tara:strand:+ start:158 stop:697 length:540 start_codon:yes stop_codon:yes gene_type:complete
MPYPAPRIVVLPTNRCSLVDKIDLLDKKPRTMSISAALESMQKRKEDSNETSLLLNQEIFSIDDLETVWLDMIKFFKEKGKSNTVIALSENTPLLKDNFEIEFLVMNSSQQEIVVEQREIILSFLREKLKNDSISIITKVCDIERKEIAYTNKDKFKKMKSKNPYLEILTQRIGLDSDY